MKNFVLGVLLGLALCLVGAFDVRAEDYGFDDVNSYSDYSYSSCHIDLSSDWSEYSSYDEEEYPPDAL